MHEVEIDSWVSVRLSELVRSRNRYSRDKSVRLNSDEAVKATLLLISMNR